MKKSKGNALTGSLVPTAKGNALDKFISVAPHVRRKPSKPAPPHIEVLPKLEPEVNHLKAAIGFMGRNK